MKLAGRVALVTGAARGIGAACCRAFAREGARVVINYYEFEDLARHLVAEINEAGGAALAVYGDVASAADVAQMVAAAHQRFGPIDILVCNATTAPL